MLLSQLIIIRFIADVHTALCFLLELNFLLRSDIPPRAFELHLYAIIILLCN